MKKFLIIPLMIIITSFSAVYSSEDKYIEALRNCSSYSDFGNVNADGVNVTSHKQILGWHGDKCRYKESVNMGNMNVDILCNFSKPQIAEITSVADAYYTTLKYSNASPDTSSIEAVQSNPIVNVFNKYLQNPNVCTMSGMQ